MDFSVIDQLLIRYYSLVRYLRKYTNKMVQYQGWFKDIVIFTALYGWYGTMKASCISDVDKCTSYFRNCLLNSELRISKDHSFFLPWTQKFF